MSNGINKVILIGNLGKDPEIRYTQNPVVSTEIAMSRTNQTDFDASLIAYQQVIGHKPSYNASTVLYRALGVGGGSVR